MFKFTIFLVAALATTTLVNSQYHFSSSLKAVLEPNTLEFISWIQKHRVNYYTAEEMAFRKFVFSQTLEEVNILNSDPESSAHFATNILSDRTE
jgi:hypothetical protein